MRIVFCLILSAMFGSCSLQKQSSKTLEIELSSRVIYGEDGRKDYFEVQEADLLELARSVPVFIQAEHLKANQQTDNYHLQNEPPKLPMCPGEKYATQPQWGFCTGALVGPDLVLTAGHCVTNEKECLHTRLIFDFNLMDREDEIKTIKKQVIFSCVEIIYRKEEISGSDFAIIRIDRQISDRKYLKFSETEVTFQNKLLVAGYPLGLPFKFTFNGQVRSQMNDKYFVATLDTFSGNSGSPVFNQDTLEIVGVLSRGEKDFERKNSCYVAKVCQGEECRGEDVTKISEVKKVWTPSLIQ